MFGLRTVDLFPRLTPSSLRGSIGLCVFDPAPLRSFLFLVRHIHFPLAAVHQDSFRALEHPFRRTFYVAEIGGRLSRERLNSGELPHRSLSGWRGTVRAEAPIRGRGGRCRGAWMDTLKPLTWTLVDRLDPLGGGYGGSIAALNHAEGKMVTMRKASELWRRLRPDQSTYHFPAPSRQYCRPRIRRRGPCSVAPPQALLFAIILLGLLVPSISAAFVNFENCLEQNIIKSNPVQLQFIPLNVSAQLQRFGSRNLTVTVYGNVTGSDGVTPPPPPDDPGWQNPNETLGKIIDLSQSNNHRSTLRAKFQYLSYTPYKAPPSPFCPSLVHGACPLGPAFDANSS